MKLKNSKYVLAALLMASSIGLSACGETQESSNNDQQTEQAAEETAKVQEMKGDELQKIENDKKEKENYLVIDVRSPEEYKEGHLKFAINMPIDTFEKDYTSIDRYKDKNVVVYCNTGKKSSKAAEILVKNGFKKVYNAEGVKQFDYELVKYNNSLGDKFKKDIEEAKDAIVIDARKAEDFAKGHITDRALNIMPDDLKLNMDKLPKDKNTPIFVYCYSGNKSSQIANELAKDGYTNVTNAVDGTKEYEYNLTK